MPARRAPVVLLVLVTAALVWSAVAPLKPLTWLMETVWVIIGLAVVLATWRRFPLTTLACVLLAVHGIVLAYGGHHGYSETPAGDAVQEWLGLERNPYDRLGHFLQGFVPAVVAREVLWRRSPLRGSRWLPWVVVAFCLAISALWELLEWAGAVVVEGGDPAFLGGQGDPWDTQWDMLLALVGALLALMIFTRWHDRQLAGLTRTTPPAAAAPRRG